MRMQSKTWTEPGRQAGRSISGDAFVMERESVTLRATVHTDVKLEYPSEPERDRFEDLVRRWTS